MNSRSYLKNNLGTSPVYEVLSRQNKRENNEDSFQVFSLTQSGDRPPIHILAVADGMGGHAHGEQASEQTLRKLSLSLFESLTVDSSINSPPEKTLKITSDRLSKNLQDALRSANEHIRRIVKQNDWGVSGSTVVVAAILENKAVIVNLGDSPLFHYQARQKHLTQITEDHTVAGILQSSGKITAEMARYHEGRSRLQFFVGCSHLPKELPTYKIELEPNDLLLLCSDGISGSLLPKDIVNILASQKSLKQKSQALVDKALANKETDNQTLILWSHSPSASVQQSKNNAVPLGLETDEIERGNGLLKWLILPSIFLGALAFGAYYYYDNFVVSKNSSSEQLESTPKQTSDREEVSEQVNPSSEKTENLESLAKRPEAEQNGQQQVLNTEESQAINPADYYFSCDSNPQTPSRSKPYKLYVKYNLENEFNQVENLLLSVCPHPDGDPTKESFKKIPNELTFEVWFNKPSEMENFRSEITQKMRERRLFSVEISQEK
ncbi:MAG: protein phosphatase 2C domain-containing protein [Prochloraceae cyanobacterium]|nr:protein phosphatase 2C domain-containing protein [Prochloraceae cyanobacterium]